MVHRLEISLRWADLDLMGHVNNVRMAEMVQEARVSFAIALAEDAGIGPVAVGADGFSQVIARVEIDYLRQVLLTDRAIEIDTTVERVGTTSFTVTHLGRVHGGHDVVRARSVMVCIDPDTGSSSPIPDQWRAAIEARIETS